MIRNWLMMVAAVVATAGMALATDDDHAQGHGQDTAHGMAQNEHVVGGPHPTVPNPVETTWAGAMVIIVIGMFVAAAAVGVVVRANAPDETPGVDSHHHDDDHAHGHGHDKPHH